MAIGNLQVVLSLNAGQFTVQMQQAGRAVQTFAGQVNQNSRSISNMERALTGMGARIRHTFVNLALARTAFHNVWLATGAWQKKIIDTAGELERMQFLLKGMSKAATEQERLNESMRDFNYIVGIAKNAPFDIAELTNSFVKMRSVGIDPMAGSFVSLLDAVARFGGTDETLHRASVAIQQMAGKGVISMEELRQQLGEAVPQAMELMARGMGMSLADFIKEVSKGTVEAKSALRKLSAEFNLAFGGSAERMMDSYVGKLSRLSTSWKLFQQQVAVSSGLFDNAKGAITRLTAALDPAQSARFAKWIGELMNYVLNLIMDSILWLVRWRKEIWTAIQILGTFAIGFKVWGVAAAIMPSMLKTIVAQLGLFKLAVQLAMLDVAGFKMVMMDLRLAMVALGKQMIAFGAWLLTTPVGIALLIAALVAGTWAWLKYGSAIGKANTALEDFEKFGIATEETVAQLNGGLAPLADKARLAASALLETTAKLKALKAIGADGKLLDWAQLPDSSRTSETSRLMQLYKSQLAQTREVTAQTLRMVKSRNEAVLLLDQQYASKAQASARDLTQAQLDEVSARYTAERDLVDKELQKFGAVNSAARQEVVDRRTATLQNQAVEVGKIYDTQISAKEKELKALEATGSKTASASIKNIKQVIDELEKRRGEALVQLGQNVSNLGEELILMPSKDTGKTDPLTSFVTTLKGNIAELKTELTDIPGDLAEFDSKVASGLYKGTKAQLDAVRDLVKQYADLKQETKDKKESDAELAEGQELVSRWTATSAEELEQLNVAMQLGGAELGDSRLRQFKRAMDALKATMSEENFAKLLPAIEKVEATLSEGAGVKIYNELMEDQRKLIMGTQLTRRAAFDEEMAQYKARVEQALIQDNVVGADRERDLSVMLSNMEAMALKFQMEGPIGQLATNWIDSTTAMQEATASWLTSATDGLVEFIETGKFNFKGFVKSILSDILKIIVRAMVAQAILSAIGMTRGGSMESINGLDMKLVGLANGGLMSSKGSAPLKRYATGGVANRPQLALYGEGRQPEAYVPLPDGRTIPVTLEGGGGFGGNAANVEVNVINQTGQQVNAEKKGQRFDGKTMILDVVLSAMNQPGSFRDGMRGSVR